MSNEQERSGYSPSLLSQDQVEALLKTASGDLAGQAYVDFLSNRPKNEQTRTEFRQLLLAQFELRLPDAVERMFDLPSLIIKRRPSAEYLDLLQEARELFRVGYFYSCVAMCGIVSERLIKDLLRQSVLVLDEEQTKQPSDEAFDQLERVDSSAIIRFVNKAGLLNDGARKAAEYLIQLRNKYAHARGTSPKADALDAIKHLHDVVEGTVSLLRDYEFSEGRLILRQRL
jgi:hypothetical protein